MGARRATSRPLRERRVRRRRSQRARAPKGRTRQGRLRLLDAWLLQAEPALCRDPTALFVDVGVGARPDTLLDWQATLRGAGCQGALIGVELVPERVQAALSLAPELNVRAGGLDLPLRPDERPSVVRCLNVLRAGPPEPQAHARLAQPLREGGVLLEGSSDTQGGVVVVHVLRAGPAGLRREGLLFLTDFSRGFAPLLFRDWLPRDLRRAQPPVLRAFLSAWTGAFADCQRALPSSPARFAAAGAALVTTRDDVTLYSELPLGGVGLLWRPAGGVPTS